MDQDTVLNNIYKEDNFVRDYIKSVDMAVVLIESACYRSIIDRLSYVFHFFPEIAELEHWKIARLTGMCRETITRNIRQAREFCFETV